VKGSRFQQFHTVHPITATALLTAEMDGYVAPTIPTVEVDVSHLNPLSPEVIENQATINIGSYLGYF
jgi:hypothetical protein